jgi:hypothetical protein
VPKRTLSLRKQRHEVSKYLHALQLQLYSFATGVRATLEPLTVTISGEGVGEVYLPSRADFEKMSPTSAPAGLIFPDSSFLAFYEIVRFGYQDERTTEPTIYRLKYGYHYQRNVDHFYFRFDHHPGIGEPETHPLHHLHAAGWLPNATAFHEGPRFKVDEVKLADVLRLIQVTYL